MKIRTILIDDEPLACMLLEDMLKPYTEIEIIAICHDGFDGLQKIQALQPDLIFVDIQMPKIIGVEMIELIEDKPMIVFSTAYDAYAIKAFEINAIDYLLKPYDSQRIAKAVDRIKEKHSLQQKIQDVEIATPESKQRIVVKEHGDIKIIPIVNITHIEAAGDYIKLFTTDKFHIKHGKISYYESLLNSAGFIRIHRSYLMNIQFINSIEQSGTGHLAVLKNGQKLPISKSGYEILKNNIN